MKALFNLCAGWETCRNVELRVLFEQRMNEGKNFKWPPKQKMIALNKLCASCNHSLELQNDECPVCGGVVITAPRFPLPGEIEPASNSAYYYKCIHCKRNLYSFERLA